MHLQFLSPIHSKKKYILQNRISKIKRKYRERFPLEDFALFNIKYDPRMEFEGFLNLAVQYCLGQQLLLKALLPV